MADLPSRAVFAGYERAAARSYLHGIGYSDEDLARPIVGVFHSWTDAMPCNANHRDLAMWTKDGVWGPVAPPWSRTPLPSPTASPWAQRA